VFLSYPGVDFINILWEAFTCIDSKSAKKTDTLTIFFEHLGSALVKALHKMLIKLTSDNNEEGERMS